MAYEPEERKTMQTACYPSQGGTARRIIGIALIVLGVVLILFCVPYWAWWALLGAALIVVGLILARSA